MPLRAICSTNTGYAESTAFQGGVIRRDLTHLSRAIILIYVHTPYTKAEVLVSSLCYLMMWYFSDEEFAIRQNYESVRTKRRTIAWNTPRLRTDSACSAMRTRKERREACLKCRFHPSEKGLGEAGHDSCISMRLASPLVAGSSGASFFRV